MKGGPPPPVFVFGEAHSGTTILYRMLAYHPALAFLSQLSLRGGEIPGRRRIPGANRLDVLLRAIPHRWQKEESVVWRWVPQPQELGSEIWHYLLEDETADVETMRARLSDVSDRHHNRRILAKWAHFHRFLDSLSTAFPQACFVHIVRDGRPVALSLREKFERTLDHDRALEAAARRWVEVLDRTEANREIDLVEVRYEELCEDVHAVLRTVLRAARLDVEPFPFDRCPTALSSRNSHWVESATSREIEEISRIQRDQLSRRGYAVTQ